MRQRGHTVSMVVVQGGKLAERARKEGFEVLEVPFKRWRALGTIRQIRRWIKEKKVDVVNTHSSLDAWLGGIAARWAGKKVVRTRHLSTPIRGGWNARLLYNALADFVVTTSSGIIPTIQEKAHLPAERIACIPTGVEPFTVQPDEATAFRQKLGVREDEVLVGTVCVVRSWKGIQDLIGAAKLLQGDKRLKWVVVGGGYIEHFQPLVPEDLPFIFTGHLENPMPAVAALDIFALLSTAHEGISQASLQAAFLKKPLVVTNIGGLPEVCLDSQTGFVVQPHAPEEVAAAVMRLVENGQLREKMGEAGHRLVLEKFTQRHMLDQMARVFEGVYALNP